MKSARPNLAALFLCLMAAMVADAVASHPVEVLPTALRGAIQPQVALAPNGNIYVAFGKGTSVYCAVSTNGGAGFLPPVAVAQLPGLALGMRRGPRIAVSNGRVTISAISHAEGNLQTWTSGDAGQTWSHGVLINSATNSAREGLHAMAGDGRGNLYAAWLDLRNKKTELWGAASRDGGVTWDADRMIYQSPDGHICECCHPSVEVAADGKVRVMWRNWLGGSRDMFTAASADGGRTFAPAEKLGTGTWPLNACPMDGGALAGAFSVWRRNAAVYYTDGTSEEHLLDAQGKQPVVTSSPAGPCFLWENNSRLMLQRGTSGEPVVFATSAAYPAIAPGTDPQPPVIVWESTTNGQKTILSQVLK